MAITSDILKQFYAFSAIPVNGGSYLTDTDNGRSFLLSMAVDLYNSINEQNQGAIPDDDEIYEDYGVFLSSELSDNFEDFYNDYINNLRNRFNLSNDDIKELPIENLTSNIRQLCLFLDRDIESKVSGRSDYNLRDFTGIGTRALNDILEYLSDSEYLNDKNKVIDILDGIFNELDSLYRSLDWEFFYDSAVSKKPFDKFYADRISEAQLHIDIAEFLGEFRNIILKAHKSKDIDDYRNVVIYIDRIMQMSHHGGPLLEYALYHNVDDLGNALGVLQAKSSPFFLNWVKSEGLLPEDAEKMMVKNRGVLDYDYSDDYYKGSRYSDQENWERENLPYDEWASRGRNSSQLGYMNAAEVWDMSQRLMKKRDDAEKSGVTDFSSDYDLSRLREMEDWSRRYLGSNLPHYRFSSKLLGISNLIDDRASDLSDKIEMVVFSHVV